MARIDLANDAFRSGHISERELAQVAHEEGVISKDEFAGFQPKPPVTERIAAGARRVGARISETARSIGRRVGFEAPIAAKAAARQIVEPVRAVSERIGPPVAKLAAVEIPGMRKAREVLERGPEIGATVAEEAARRGIPGAAALGIAAGAPTTFAATVLPTPETVGEAATTAALIAAAPGAARLAPRAFPVLGRPVGALARRLRQRVAGVRPGEPIEVFPEPQPGFKPAKLRKRAPEAKPAPKAPGALPFEPAPIVRAGEVPITAIERRIGLPPVKITPRPKGVPAPAPRPAEPVPPPAQEPMAEMTPARIAEQTAKETAAREIAAGDPTYPVGTNPTPEALQTFATKRGALIHRMTAEEFGELFPQADAALHSQAIIKAINRGEEVPQEALESRTDVIKHFEREASETLRKEFEASMGERGISKTPVLSLIRKFKITPESYKLYRGELEPLERELVRSAKGRTLPELAEQAWEAGLIEENSENALLRHIEHEKRTGTRAPLQALPGAAMAGRGGFIGPRPAPAPAPEEPLGRTQREYESKIIESTEDKPGRGWRELMDKLYTEFVDRTNPINNLSKFTKDAPPYYNLEFLTRRWMGAAGIAEANLRMRTSLLGKDGNVIDTGEGLGWVLRDAESRRLYGPLRTYMVAVRDLELARAGKKGLDAAKAAELLPFLKQKHGPLLQGMAERIWDWEVRTFLDPLLDVGALSKEKYDIIRRSGQVYVPFLRVMSDIDIHGSVLSKGGQLFIPTSIPIKRFKGSDRPIHDPFETMIQMAYFTADYVERVRIGNAIWENRQFSPELAKEIVEVKARVVPVSKDPKGEPIFARSLYPPEKNAIPFMKAGKLKWMRVPNDVAEAVQNMRMVDLGIGMKVVSYPAKLLRAGVILDPEFSLGRNVPRDIVSAAIFAKYGITPSSLMRGFMSAITGSDKLHFKWMASGSDMSTMMAIDRAGSNIRLAQIRGVRELQELSPIALLQRLTEIGEQTTRKGIFDRASRKGASDLEAMYESRTGTVDFGNQGSSAMSRSIRMAVPFHGASLSGMATLGKAFRKRPFTTFRRAVLGITIPSVILWLARLDDEELQEVPQWEKDSFWIGKVPGTNRIWRIPKPHELGLFFGTAVEHALDYVLLNDPEAIRTLRARMFDTVVPPITPPPVKVGFELWANKSMFTNKPIVPKAKERLRPELQFGEYTSETAKQIGTRIGVAPSKVDHIIRGTAGTLGRTTASISDAVMRRMKLIEAPAAPVGAEPLEGLILAKPPIGTRSESVNRFFNIWENLETEHASRLATTSIQVPPSLMLQQVRRAKGRMIDLRNANNLVRQSRFFNPDQKKMMIEKNNRNITKIARQVVQVVERRRRDIKARDIFKTGFPTAETP